MAPKKKTKKMVFKDTQEALAIAAESAMKPTAEWGAGPSHNPANASKALLLLPAELLTNILSHFRSIGPLTAILDPHENSDIPAGRAYPYDRIGPVLPIRYIQRPSMLRALSQTCVAWRKTFLPLLWESMDACVTNRSSNTFRSFFKHVGATLLRKCLGLTQNPEIGAMVGVVNVCLTRYQTDIILPAFTQCLRGLPNLHTIHVLHAHTQMTTAIKVAFEGVSLPSVRTVIIPGYCHELLKSCPEVRSVRCIRDDGSKLVGVMGKNCQNVDELRGFWCRSANFVKRLVKAAPRLRILEIEYMNKTIADDVINHLKSFKRLCTIELVHDGQTTLEMSDPELQATISKLRHILMDSPSKERKYLRLTQKQGSNGGGDPGTAIDIKLE